MSIVRGHAGALYMPTGSATTFTTEACDQKAGTVYHITDASMRQWDPATAVSVYDDGVLQTTGYHLHAAAGEIHFDEAPTTPVTVSGKYYEMAAVGKVGKWQLDLKQGTVKTSGLGEARAYQGTGLLDWSGSFEKLEEDDTYAAMALDNTVPVVAKLYESLAAPVVWVGYIVPEGWGLDAPDEDALKETLSFKGTDALTFLTSES